MLRWPVTATITLWTKSIEQIWLNKWSIEQNQTAQITSLTNSHWPKLDSPSLMLNKYLVEQIPIKQWQANKNLTQSKPQLIQTTMNPSHRGEGCNKFLHARGAQRPRALATWPSGRRLVRFEPSHNWSKPQCPYCSLYICSIDYLMNLNLFSQDFVQFNKEFNCIFGE